MDLFACRNTRLDVKQRVVLELWLRRVRLLANLLYVHWTVVLGCSVDVSKGRAAQVEAESTFPSAAPLIVAATPTWAHVATVFLLKPTPGVGSTVRYIVWELSPMILCCRLTSTVVLSAFANVSTLDQAFVTRPFMFKATLNGSSTVVQLQRWRNGSNILAMRYSPGRVASRLLSCTIFA